MQNNLPVTGVIPISQMTVDETEEEAKLLLEMSDRAQAFLTSFVWCTSIREFYFGEGIGGVFGVFFAYIQPSRSDIDEYLWVVVGDLPFAYLVTDVSKKPKEAMIAYIGEMRKWIELAIEGKTSGDVIPG